MSLPLSRNTTYAAGSQVKSADLNDLQDMIIGGKRGAGKIWLPWQMGQPISSADELFNTGTYDTAAAKNQTGPGAAQALYYSPQMIVGAVVSQVDVYYADSDATYNLDFALEIYNSANEITKSSSGSAGTIASLTFDVSDDANAFPFTIDPENMDFSGSPTQSGIMRLRVSWPNATSSLEYYGSLWHFTIP